MKDKGPPWYRKLREVEILSATPDLVTFATDARLTSAQDTSPAADRRIQGTFVVQRSKIWATAGGPGIEACVELAQGRVGPLYIEDTTAGVKGTSLGGKSVYARCVRPPLLADELAYRPKWPDAGDAEGVYSPLPITSTSIMLTGYVPGSSTSGSVELLDPAFTLGQKLRWGGGRPITLELTKQGYVKFAPWPDTDEKPGTKKITIWPISIVVKGAPTDGTAASGSVDLRNLALSAAGQELEISKANTVKLELSEQGKLAFRWVSPARRKALGEVLSAVREQPQLASAFDDVHEILLGLETTDVDAFERDRGLVARLAPLLTAARSAE